MQLDRHRRAFADAAEVGLAERLGAEQVLFGSDYPHAEGLAVPTSFAESIANLSGDSVRQIMSVNGRTLAGLA